MPRSSFRRFKPALLLSALVGLVAFSATACGGAAGGANGGGRGDHHPLPVVRRRGRPPRARRRPRLPQGAEAGAVGVAQGGPAACRRWSPARPTRGRGVQRRHREGRLHRDQAQGGRRGLRIGTTRQLLAGPSDSSSITRPGPDRQEGRRQHARRQRRGGARHLPQEGGPKPKEIDKVTLVPLPGINTEPALRKHQVDAA